MLVQLFQLSNEPFIWSQIIRFNVNIPFERHYSVTANGFQEIHDMVYLLPGAAPDVGLKDKRTL